MNKILTIIIPSYNIARYIDSILPPYICESLFSKVQLLFIDDGAKDNTVQLLEQYEKKYPDYISIVKKENGGHGSVINCGVKLCKTKYFKVIDGDDWIDSSELLKLCDYLYDSDSDVVVSDFTYEFNDRSPLSLGLSDNKSKFPYKLHLHNVTFKTSLWTNNNIKVREKVFYEDAQYVLYPLEYAKTITYFKANVYHYRCDNPNQSVNPLQQLKHKDDYVVVAKDLCEFYDSLKDKPDIDKLVKEYVADNLTRIVFGAYEICTSKGIEFNESYKMCKELDATFKKHPSIFKLLKKKYRKYRLLKLFNYSGLKYYLKH